MNRRTFLTTTSAAIALTAAGNWSWGSNLASAQTPIASPEATAGALTYEQVGPAYAAARNELLTLGRPVVDTLLGGDPLALWSQMTPELQEAVPQDYLASLRPTLETNRVHFAAPEFGATFDGHLDGRTISGFFTQGAVVEFTLTAEGDATPVPSSPLDGRWSGEITDDPPIPITVTFQSSGDPATAPDLTASIDVPSQQTVGMALSNVSFLPAKPLGERRVEYPLPMSLANRLYVAQYPWGDDALTITVAFTSDGTIGGLMLAPEWPLPPDPAAGFLSNVAYRLPFDGVWLTAWGGDTVVANYHAEAPNQRHAYDLVVWNEGGTFRGEGTQNSDYWAWGQPILAPAAGTVVAVLNDLPDNTPGAMAPEPHPAGNHVVLQTANGEFVFLCHLQTGSVRVAPNDQIAAGTVVGLTGNSGNSSEAHLHIHVQDRADFFDPAAVGLPLVFTNFRADGQPVERGTPTRSQLISNA